MYKEIYPSPEEILEMEPEELAPFLLKHIDAKGGDVSLHNFSIGTSPSFVEWAGSDNNIRHRILEHFIVAWRWLEKELFIAPKPGNVDWSFITPKGRRILESQDFETHRQGYLLPSDGLDPNLVRKVRSLFIRGDYDSAVLLAFKEVEVRVRDKAGLSNSDHGVNLMRKAFGPPDGPLVDANATPGEQSAIMDLFAGAIGSFKNPSSHRYIEFEDPKEAADLISHANQLLRIVERA